METLTLEITDKVAVLAFNRPQALNALTPELVDEFQSALDEILAPQAGVRCLLLTGAGRAFSSGADLAVSISQDALKDLSTIDVGLMLETHFNPLIERLLDMPIPFVTAINGAAAGAGCSFAIAADIAIAARSAYFLLAFVNIGLVPDVGCTWILPRLIGRARAQAMMLLGEKISAETARDWGMIYDVVDDDELQSRAMTIAQKLANGPTRTLELIRRSSRLALERSLEDQLHQERIDQLAAGRTRDFVEGVSAFLHKRPAVFTGL